MSFKKELQELKNSNQNNNYSSTLNEIADIIITMGKDELRKAVTDSASNKFIKTTLFGKKILSKMVTTLYTKQYSTNSNGVKGFAFTMKYDGEIYGFQLYDLNDLNHLVDTIRQKCKSDEIEVKTKKDSQGLYNLFFEISI